MHLELLRIFAWPMAIVVLGLGSLVIFWKPIARKIGEATELRLRNHLFMRAGLRGSETEPEEEVDQADTAAAPRQARSRLLLESSHTDRNTTAQTSVGISTGSDTI